MSDRQLDAEVVNEGRKSTLKDVDASLRDQIPKKLLKKLQDMKAGVKVVDLWMTGQKERANWLERQRTYLSDWDEFLVNHTSGPFEGSSQLHLPTSFIACKTYHARYMEALFGIDPPFNLKPGPFSTVEEAQAVSNLMRHAIKYWCNYNKGAEAAVSKWVWDWIVTGTGIIKRRWDRKYVSYMDVETIIEQDAPQFTIDPQTGQEILVPQFKSVEKEVLKTEKCFEGPILEPVLIDDYLAIGKPDNLTGEIQRQMLTASDLWTLVDQKIFNADAVERVILSGGDKKNYATLSNDRDMNAGVELNQNNTDLERYEILEAYVQMDVDGSGINSEVILWVHTTTMEILRATYLHRVNKGGKRPFSVIHFFERQESLYGMGLVEVLYPLTTELDAMRNMRIDFGMISTAPFGFYRASSSLNPETLQYSPGTLIPVDNPQTDVYFPNLGNRTAFGLQEEAAIHDAIEKLTGLSALSYGSMGEQGATRTATGTRALVAEANSNLNVHLRRLNIGWRDLLVGLFHDLQQRVEPGFAYRTTGNDGSTYWEKVNLETLMKDYDFEIEANSSSSNPMIRLDNAHQILQLTANPMDIQLGVISPTNRYEAVKNYLMALGVQEVSKYITKVGDYRISLAPQEEVQRILAGYDVPVQLQGDHQGFLEYFEFMTKHEDMLSQLTQEQRIALQRQAVQHAQAQQAMQQQQAQQMNQQQQMINAQQNRG